MGFSFDFIPVCLQLDQLSKRRVLYAYNQFNSLYNYSYIVYSLSVAHSCIHIAIATYVHNKSCVLCVTIFLADCGDTVWTLTHLLSFK